MMPKYEHCKDLYVRVWVGDVFGVWLTVYTKREQCHKINAAAQEKTAFS